MHQPRAGGSLLGGAIALGLSSAVRASSKTVKPASSFADILREPDLVRIFGEDGEIASEKSGGHWRGKDVDLAVKVGDGKLSFDLRAQIPITRIQVRWRGDLSSARLFLGDHWERGYGDMEWRGGSPNRVMPWYFLVADPDGTHGYGVKTGPNAMCFWTADSAGISLWIDVRNGTKGVQLGDRVLHVCDVVCRRGKRGENSFAAAKAFCKMMCDRPRLPKERIYGTNDWYYAYGNNSADLIARVSQMVVELSPSGANRPYSVVDDGWSQGGLGHGPWEGNERFGPMDAYAKRLRDIGVRPGIWFRPLTPLKDHPETWRHNRDKRYLDPTVPEVQEWVRSHISRLRGWGYELIKHDYTSWDLMGRWGMSMGAELTSGDWAFHDRSKTTAEVILGLYRTIRDAAGDVLIDGCNTFSHLSAGIFELYRAGDDTSGESWDRTRKMGVNTLAFRAAQHGAFYAVDGDIVPITDKVPWDLTERWMDLLAWSGTPFFVSPQPEAMTADRKAALKRALAVSAKELPLGEPLDWQETICPARWQFGKEQRTFNWFPATGGAPLPEMG